MWLSHFRILHRRLNAQIPAQGFSESQRQIDRGLDDWTAGAGLSGHAERIVMPVVVLEFIIEKTELPGPLTRIFPVRNKIGEPGGQQLCRESFNGAADQLILPTEREPGDEARALLAQIAKKRRFLGAENDADETTLIDVDQPIHVGI